eukprot:1162889-Amphidinium_carterae.2
MPHQPEHAIYPCEEHGYTTYIRDKPCDYSLSTRMNRKLTLKERSREQLCLTLWKSYNCV